MQRNTALAISDAKRSCRDAARFVPRNDESRSVSRAAMKEIADRIEEVRVVVGAEAFGSLLPAGLLARIDKMDSS